MRPDLPRRSLALLAALLLLLLPAGSLLTPTQASALDATWEGSKAEEGVAKTADALLIRPLSVLRFAVGIAFFVPAALFAAPGGRENVEEVYDVLVARSVDYAFRRKLGEP
ncbi:MAG TPA: hypothetical protein ENI85_08875 [Deltaproteobacteria bacterium]|nr:hypothetical protein [Deltaproteobacteria bacterium]